MTSDNIIRYAKSQNFALVNSNIPDGTILRNMESDRALFLVVLDNTRSHLWSAPQLQSLNSQLKSFNPNGRNPSLTNDILVIIVSGNIERDKSLAGIDGINLWIADNESGKILIYENQPSDFYGLYNGISAAAGSKEDGAPKVRSNFRTNFPFVTVALVVANVVFFIILLAGGNVSNTSYMISAGANYAPLVFEDFQVWRLLTSMFIHFSFSHLVSNMIYLAMVGYSLERPIGHAKFLLIYLLSGLGASLTSAAYYYITDANTISAGASGAIYGLIGVITFLTAKNIRHMKPAYIFYRLGIVIIFVFYSSFMRSDVDGAAHVGGFIFGILLSILFLNSTNKKGER